MKSSKRMMFSSFAKICVSSFVLSFCAATFSGCTLKNIQGVKVQNATASAVQPSESVSGTAQASSVTSGSTDVSSTGETAPSAVQPEGTQADWGKWQVTDPVQEPDRSQAQLDFDAASDAVQSGQYALALKLAAQSYQAVPSDETRSLAMYAAMQLSPIELANLESSITFPLEAAVAGQLRLNTCASMHDNACVAALLPGTAMALEAIGDSASAERLRTMLARASNSSQPVVAVLLPLSGTDRRVGRAMLGSILQASGIYHHSSLPFDLRFFDTQSNVQTIPGILAEVQKLGARLILGPLDIQESMAVVPNLAEIQTVMLGFSPNDEFTKQSSAAFQFSYALTLEAEQLAQTIVALNVQRMVAVSPEDAYASTLVQQLQTSLPTGMAVSHVTFPQTQTDLRDIAHKIASQSPEVVYFPTSIETAERIASFLAQENLWCKTPGTPAPQSKLDTRKFTTCIGSSAWAPVADNHRYKSLHEALYLDYTDAAAVYVADFDKQFQALYHRLPAVHEILPFVAVSMLKTLPDEVWQNPESLQQGVQTLLRGQKYLMLPSLRQITSTGSQSFGMVSTTAPALERTLSTAKP